VALGRPVVPGHDVAGPVAGEAPALGLGGDLRRPLGVDLHGFLGDAGDGPLAQAARRAVVTLDAVSETDGLPGCGHPADHGGGVEVVPGKGHVRRLPATTVVLHAHEVGDKHMVVRRGVAGPAGGVARHGVGQARGGRGYRRRTTPAAA
jgi:hypothetical protein